MDSNIFLMILIMFSQYINGRSSEGTSVLVLVKKPWFGVLGIAEENDYPKNPKSILLSFFLNRSFFFFLID